MGEVCHERPLLAECVAQAIDYTRGVISAADDATERVKRAAMRIVEVSLDLHSDDPASPFPLTRERMAAPPKKSHRFAPRGRGRLPESESGAAPKFAPRRNKWNVIDRHAGDPRVKWLRERLGNETSGIIQAALNLIEKCAIFSVERLGKMEGKRRNYTNAWRFGTIIANLLSKALLSTKSESKRDQKRALRLSDFFKVGAERHGVSFAESLVEKVLKGTHKARKAVVAKGLAMMRAPKAAPPPPEMKPARPPEPSFGEKLLNPKGWSQAETERAIEEERLARLEASGGALKGLTLSPLVSRTPPG